MKKLLLLCIGIFILTNISALTTINACGTFTAQDDYELGQDIDQATLYVDCLVFNESASGSTFDCKGYDITAPIIGLNGIYVKDINDMIINNCKNISKYDFAIYTENAENITITNISAEETFDSVLMFDNTTLSSASYFSDSGTDLTKLIKLDIGSSNNSFDNFNGTGVMFWGDTTAEQYNNFTNFRVISNNTNDGLDSNGGDDSYNRFINGTIINYQQTYTGVDVLSYSHLENIYIEGFLDGLIAKSYSTYINITINSTGREGLVVSGRQNSTFLGLNIRNNFDRAIILKADSDNNIIDCDGGEIFHRYTGGAIEIQSNTISNNTFQNCVIKTNQTYPQGTVLTYYGINIFASVINIDLVNITYQDVDRGLLNYGSWADVINTNCNNTGYCIYLDGSAEGLYNYTSVTYGVHSVGITEDPLVTFADNNQFNFINLSTELNAYGINLMLGNNNSFSYISCNSSYRCMNIASPDNIFDCGNWTSINQIGLGSSRAFIYNTGINTFRNCKVTNASHIIYDTSTGSTYDNIIGENFDIYGIYLTGDNNVFTNITISGPQATADLGVSSTQASDGHTFIDVWINNSGGGDCFNPHAVRFGGADSWNLTDVTCYNTGNFIGLDIARERNDGFFVRNFSAYGDGSGIGISVGVSDNHNIYDSRVINYGTGISMGGAGTGSLVNNSIFCDSTTDASDSGTNTWDSNTCDVFTGGANCEIRCSCAILDVIDCNDNCSWATNQTVAGNLTIINSANPSMRNITLDNASFIFSQDNHKVEVNGSCMFREENGGNFNF